MGQSLDGPIDVIAIAPIEVKNNGNKGNSRALPAGNGSHGGRSGRPVLQTPFVAAATR